MELQVRVIDNEVFVNGVQLTKEQSEKILDRSKPYLRAGEKETYFYINECDTILDCLDYRSDVDNALYTKFNYFLDPYEAQQVMLHQLLYRKLFRYAYSHKAEVTKKDWENDNTFKYFIYSYKEDFFVDYVIATPVLGAAVYFKDKTTAEKAIEDVIKPFMEEHLDFIW